MIKKMYNAMNIIDRFRNKNRCLHNIIFFLIVIIVVISMVLIILWNKNIFDKNTLSF